MGGVVAGGQSAFSMGGVDARGCAGDVVCADLGEFYEIVEPGRGRDVCVWIQRPDGGVAAFFGGAHRVLGRCGDERGWGVDRGGDSEMGNAEG